MVRWLQEPGGCFTKVSRASQNDIAKIYIAKNNIYAENYKVSAWNSHKKYDFSNMQISREYFGELAKHKWNTPQVISRHDTDLRFSSKYHVYNIKASADIILSQFTKNILGSAQNELK